MKLVLRDRVIRYKTSEKNCTNSRPETVYTIKSKSCITICFQACINSYL